MKVKLKPIRAFEVIGPGGSIVAVTQVGSEWNGMLELRTDKGEKLVVDYEDGPTSRMLADVFNFSGDVAHDATLLKASPSIVAALQREAAKAEGGAS